VEKIWFITGTSKGFGREFALAALERGDKVAATARDTSTLAPLADRFGDAVLPLQLDVTDRAQVFNSVAATKERFGRIDVVVNNAGYGLFGAIEEITDQQLRDQLETNLFGVFHCCRAAIPEMKRRGGGYIINISSLAGANPHPQMSAYNASKFALNGFSEALMQEVRHDGIKVSYIMPGSVNTHFGGDTPDDAQSWQLQPADIARVVLDLLHHDERSLPSRVEIRPSRPPKK